MNTEDKVNRIINEIHGGRQQKSVKDVMDTLLSGGADASSDSQSRPVSEDMPRLISDMRELEIWRENNNRLYQVNYYRPIYSGRKLIGRTLVFVRRIIRRMIRFLLEPIVRDQNEFNGSVTASINAVYNNTIVFQSFMDDMGQRIKEMEALRGDTEKALTHKIQQMEVQRGDMAQQLQQLEVQREDMERVLTQQLQQLEARHKDTELALVQQMEALKNDTEALRGQLTEARGMMAVRPEVNAAIDELYILMDRWELQALRAVKSISGEFSSGVSSALPSSSEKVSNGEDIYGTIDYFDFENHFRGTRKNIKVAQSIYLPYFKDKNMVIDLGCGRGEFLELMQAHHVNGIGVDAYEDFVVYCQMKGLKAIHKDANQYLREIPENSVDGIFAAQLAEHLETRQLIELCKRAYEVLSLDGCFIIETPNPTCLATYYSWFYVDPSHIKPVHPLTLEYFLKQAGFKRTQVLYTEQSKTGYRLPLLESEHVHNLEQYNDGVNRLSDILFGSMDYAIIAVK